MNFIFKIFNYGFNDTMVIISKYRNCIIYICMSEVMIFIKKCYRIFIDFFFYFSFPSLQTVTNGLTGRIEFNEGKRSNFKLDLLKLKREQLVKVGVWNPVDGINITDPTAFYESNVRKIYYLLH